MRHERTGSSPTDSPTPKRPDPFMPWLGYIGVAIYVAGIVKIAVTGVLW